MEALTLKELKKIEKWYAEHDDDMTPQDTKLYDKINMIIEEMEDDEEVCVKTSLYDDDSVDELDEESKDSYYYDSDFEED